MKSGRKPRRKMLDYFVSTPSGVMHAENHRRLLEALPERSATRLLLLPAIKIDAMSFFAEKSRP